MTSRDILFWGWPNNREKIGWGQRQAIFLRCGQHLGLFRVGDCSAILPRTHGRWGFAQAARHRPHPAKSLNDLVNVGHGIPVQIRLVRFCALFADKVQAHFADRFLGRIPSGCAA
jgi:hypothetical protein